MIRLEESLCTFALWALERHRWRTLLLRSRPSAMNKTRSAASRANPISWLTTSMVMPSGARSRMTSRTSLIISGSSARRGLVEEHDRRLHRQRPRDRHALLLAAGELRGIARGLLGNADAFEQAWARSSAIFALSLRTLRGASVMLSSTVICGNRLNDCCTMPTCDRELVHVSLFRVHGYAVDDDLAGLDGLEAVDGA